MAVHNSNHPEGLFIGCVGDQVIADANETQWPVCEISAFMTLMWEWNQALDGVENVYDNPVRGIRTVCRNVASDFINISVGFRMKLITAVFRHRLRLRSASVFAISRAKASSPGIIFTFPLLMSS